MTNYFMLLRRKDDMPAGAELMFTAEGDELEPWVPAGGRVFVTHREQPEMGELGIFLVDGALLCRQYAEDSEGTVYLLAPNRARRELDLIVPPGRDIWCYGRVLLDRYPPLPAEIGQ